VNIGIEGQITLGAISTTLVLRLLQHSDVSPQSLFTGCIKGLLVRALWAALAGH
jgi:simple sugar transport system permease protein